MPNYLESLWVHLRRSFVGARCPAQCLVLTTSFLCFVTLTPLPSGDCEAEVILQPNNVSESQAECAIAINPLDPQNMVIAGFPAETGFPLNAHIATYYTTNGGISWSRVDITGDTDGLSTLELGTSTINQRADPSVAFGPDGTVYVAYIGARADVVHYVVCAISTDGGASYDTAYVVPSELPFPDKSFIATGPRYDSEPGYSVYIAYNEKGYSDVTVARSDDYGLSWVEHDLGDGSFAVPAVDANGRLYVVWAYLIDEGVSSTIHCAYSDDGGASFSSAAVLASTWVSDRNSQFGDKILADPYGINACPSIAIDSRESGITGIPGRVYVSYVTRTGMDEAGTGDSDGDDTDVALQYFDPAVGAWSAPRIVHSTQPRSEFHPWVTVDQSSGVVALAYLDARNDPSNKAVETFVSVSLDGGDTWYERALSTHPTDVSCHPSRCGYREYIGAAAIDDTVCVVWPMDQYYSPEDPCTNWETSYAFGKMAIGEVAQSTTYHVPWEWSLSAAFGAARAGDVVSLEASTTVSDRVLLSSNVHFVSSTSTNVLSGTNGVFQIPVRYYGDGIANVALSGFNGPAIVGDVPSTHLKGNLRIDGCELVAGANCARAILLSNMKVSVADLSMSGGDTAVVVVAPAGGALSDCTLDGDVVGLKVTGGALAVSNCSLEGGTVGLKVTGGTVAVTGGAVAGGTMGLQVTNGTVQASGVTVEAGTQAVVDCSEGEFKAEDSDLVGSSCAMGIRAVDGAVMLDGCRVSGFTDVGVSAQEGTIDLEDTELTGASTTAVGVRMADSEGNLEDGLPKNRILRCALSSGDTALVAVNSNVWVDSTTVGDYSSCGVYVSADQPGDDSRYVVSNCTFVGPGDAGKGIGADLVFASSLERPLRITNCTLDEWLTGLEVSGVFQPSQEQEVGGGGPKLLTPILRRNIVRNVGSYSEGVGIKTTDIDVGGGEIKDNVVYQPYGVALDPPRSGNSVEDPLFCSSREGKVAEYTLRWDSPAAPGQLSSVLVGARHVECAWGTLARDATVEAIPILVLEDVTVPSGLTLTLNDGAILRFDDDDNSASGSNQAKNELIVAGSLEVAGSVSDTVKFVSSKPSPTEGDWYGIAVASGGEATIDCADIRHAVYGASVGTNEGSTITHSRFGSNQTYDIYAGASGGSAFPLRIAHNTVTVGGGTGIFLHGVVDGAVVDSNAVVGGSAGTAGLTLASVSDSGSVSMRGNSLSGFSNGAGVWEDAPASLTMIQNSVSSCKWGIRVTSGSPVIGTTADSDNYFTSNVTGVYAEGGAAKPILRNNYIASNTYGVQAKSVIVSGGAQPDLGTGTNDRGNNYLAGNTTYCIWNRNSGGNPGISAQYNYFGECDQGVPPFCAYGNVDVSGDVCTPPATAAKVSMVETPLPPQGFRIASIAPNPMLSGSDIQLSLDQGRTRARVEIFDVTGRLVRSFGESEVGQGRSLVHWDGRNDRGVPVNSGIYFVRARSSEGQQGSARILVAR